MREYTLEAYIVNLGKYTEGDHVGEFVRFPTTKQYEILPKMQGLHSPQAKSGARPEKTAKSRQIEAENPSNSKGFRA